MHRVVAALVVAATFLVGLPSIAASQEAQPIESGRVDTSRITADQFVALFDQASLEGLGDVGASPPITGDPSTDARIRQIAERRGYRRRAQANVALAVAHGVPLQPAAAAALDSMRAAAAASGIAIDPTFGFRSVYLQRTFFLRRVGVGSSDSEIDAALAWVAPPGYSKHHTGYTIDVADSDGYSWLSRDNYANAAQYGWIPSYPPGATSGYGPSPEPWEFTYVGREAIECFVDRCGTGFSGYHWLAKRKRNGVHVAITPISSTIDVELARWSEPGQ